MSIMGIEKVVIDGVLYELEIDKRSKEGRELSVWLSRYDISKVFATMASIVFLVVVLLHVLAFSAGMAGWVFLIPFSAILIPLGGSNPYIGYLNYIILTISSWVFYFISRSKLKKILNKYE